jgi:uncharacterized DUF497 family protein
LGLLRGALIREARQGRYKAIGESAAGLIAVIFAALGSEAVSIISMRRASRKERKLYAEAKETDSSDHR